MNAPAPTDNRPRARHFSQRRVFDSAGLCVLPMVDVKKILGISIDYEEESISIYRGKKEWTFDRSEFATPWECLRHARLLGEEFKNNAIAYLSR